jgi:hypothetical protein
LHLTEDVTAGPDDRELGRTSYSKDGLKNALAPLTEAVKGNKNLTTKTFRALNRILE